MTFNVRTARRLFTSPETDLYLKSRKSGLLGLTEKQLQRSMIRARSMHKRLARQAGRHHPSNVDITARSALSLEVLHRFERHFAEVMMEPSHHNQKHGSAPKVTDIMQHVRLGPPGEETRARAHADEIAQGGSARIVGMGASQSRRKQTRNDKH